MELNGIRQYVYSARFGVASVAADSGAVLWTYPDWRIKIAAIASPLPIEGDRIFFSGGYGAGSAMAQVTSAEGVFTLEEIYRLKPRDFGAEQQTPIYYKGHIYGVIPSGELACLSTDGKVLWAHKPPTKKGFGLGPYLIADGLILVLNDQAGTLHLAEASPDGYNELGKAKVLDGHDAWGPMALAGGRLVLRDLTEMICVDIGG
jgi:outer membrane protein assembly factor BamB